MYFRSPVQGYGTDSDNAAQIGIREFVPQMSSKNLFDFPSIIEKYQQILQLEGITGISQYNVTSYDFIVMKGSAFSWDELKPQIQAILEPLVITSIVDDDMPF